MTCLLCLRPAVAVDDPRLPLLRVLLCRRCRDWIARRTGWQRHRGTRTWMRGPSILEVFE